MNKKILLLIMLGLFFLIPLSSAGFFDWLFGSGIEITQSDTIYINNYSTSWNVIKSSGNEGNFKTIFTNLKDKKTDICFVLKDGVNPLDVDLSDKTLYDSEGNIILDDKNKPIVLKYESSKCNDDGIIKDGYHISLTEAQSVNIDDYIKLGNNSIIMVYQDQNEVVFSVGENKNISSILYWDINKDGSDWNNTVNDVFVFFNESKWKYGARHNETEWEHYKYVLSSDVPLVREDNKYYFLGDEKYLINTSDICSKTNGNLTAECSFNPYTKNGKYYLDIEFWSDEFIDPSYEIENLSSGDEEIIHKNKFTNCINNEDGTQTCNYYSKPINVLSNGEYQSCSENMDYSITNNKINFTIGDENLVLEYSYDDENSLPFFDLNKTMCNFYFTQNILDDELNITQINFTIPEDSNYENNILSKGDIVIDFREAIEKQGINIEENNGILIFTGENITKLDPTVGLVDNNSIIDGWKNNFCDGDSWDEDVTGFNLEAGAESSGSCSEAWRSFLEFNLSDIPDSATSIDEVILQLRTVSNSAGRTIYIRNITGNYQPSQDYLTDSAFWDALEEGVSFGNFSGSNYGIQNHTLNSDAESYLLDSLSRDWFAVSIHNPDSEFAESNTITFNTNEAITQSYKPVLYVTYTGGGDTDAPTWSNPSNTSDNFWKGENFTANVSMADENSLDVYIFSTNASGSWTNYTTDITGITYDATETKELEVSGNVCWYYWFNDTSNNINSTDTFCFESFNPPRIDLDFYSPLNDSQINKTELNPIKFNVTCKDNNCGEINLTAYYKVDDYVNIQDITKDETSYSGTCSSPTDAYDEDYDTEALSSTTEESCKISMNTTKPDYIDNALLDFKYEQNGATTRVSCWNYTSGSFYDFSLESSGTVRENKTIPFGCLNGDKVRMEVELTEGASSSARFYEHSIWWNSPEYKEIPLDSSFLFTNTTNPFQVSLNQDDFSEITFWVNTTADEFTNYTFLGIGNMTTYPSINNRSDEVNVIVNYNDVQPPTWTVIPNNESINYTEYWAGVTFEATDDGTIDDYYINWSDTFSITGGLLQNSTPLSAGSYRINVTVNDTSGNLNSTLYNLEVNKSESACNIYLNETSPIFTLSAFRVWTDCDSAFNLYRNGSIIANNSEQQLNDGEYNFSVVRTDQLNYTNIYDEETMIVSGDTIFPLFTNYEDNNNTFNDSGTAYFNVTIEFTNGTAGISFDGVNYSATNESNIFNVTIPIDFSGTYEYYWWAFGNGSQDNYNQSDVFIFYVGASERKVIHNFKMLKDSIETSLAKIWSDGVLELLGSLQLFKTNTLGDCSSTNEGSMLYSQNLKVPCFCNSTDWVKVEDSSVIC